MASEIHNASFSFLLTLWFLGILFLFGDNFYIGGVTHFGGLIEQTEANQFMRSFFVLASLFVTLISGQFLNQKQLPKAEYLHLILLSCAGLCSWCNALTSSLSSFALN